MAIISFDIYGFIQTQLQGLEKENLALKDTIKDLSKLQNVMEDCPTKG